MSFVVTGLNHTTAPIAVRERLYFEPDDVREVLPELTSDSIIKEAEIVSTCNRTEVHLVAEHPEHARQKVRELFAERCGLASGKLNSVLYEHQQEHAVRHLFRLASSLDSMIVGEPQITGQLKKAYQLARDVGTVSNLLDRLVTKSFSVAKRVRSETSIGESAVSIPYAAVESAKRIFGDLSDTHVGILGTGEMGVVTLKNLVNQGITKRTVISHSQDRADSLAAQFQAKSTSLRNLENILPELDILVTCTSTIDGVFPVTREMVALRLRDRKQRPLYIIDIAMPRNVDPSIDDFDEVFLYDVDSLARVVESNRELRQTAAKRAEHIVTEETQAFMSWYRSLQVVPTISALHGLGQSIAREESEKALRKLQHLDERDQAIVHQAIRGVVQRFLHLPTSKLRSFSEEKTATNMAEALNHLYELDAEIAASYLSSLSPKPSRESEEDDG